MGGFQHDNDRPRTHVEIRKEMFFIFGMPRSGTTLLSQCLSAHTEIVVPHETDFVIPMAFLFDRIHDPEVGRELICKLIVNTAAFSGSLGEYVDAATVRDVVYASRYHPSDLLNALYRKIAEAAGAKIAGDKSPNDLNFLRMLVKTGGLSEDIKVIQIVRDVRDLMISVKKTGWVADLDLYFPRFWSNHNLYLNAIYRDKPARYLLLRYEDFVAAPEEHLSTACRFLGVEFQEGMLSPANRHGRYKNADDIHGNLYQPITTKRTGVYKTSLTEEALKNYETQAREALIAFGYLSQ